MRHVAWHPIKPSKAHRVYYARGTDHLGTVRKLKGYPSRSRTSELARRVAILVDCASSGDTLPEDVGRWVNDKLDPDRKGKLIEWGILSTRYVMAGLPLADHVEAWRSFLRGQNRAEAYIALQTGRALEVLQLAGAVTHADITAERVIRAMELLAEKAGRAPGRKEAKLSLQSRRHYLNATKAFCNWMHKFERCGTNPLKVLPLPTVRAADRARRTRALDAAEQRRLITGTRDLPARASMDGATRSLFYLLALSCGYRREAMLELRVGNLRLGKSPMVTPPEGGRKARVAVPLTADVAKMLQPLVKDRDPGDVLFPGVGITGLRYAVEHDAADLGIATLAVKY